MSRYDAASAAARNLLDGFDEVDLAEMCAQLQERNRSLQQQIAQATAEPVTRAGHVLDLTDPDVLVHVVARRGPGNTSVITADSPGLNKVGAAYTLRQIADRWHPAADQHTEITQLWVNVRQQTDAIRTLLAGVDIRNSAAAWDLGVQVLLILDGPPDPTT